MEFIFKYLHSTNVDAPALYEQVFNAAARHDNLLNVRTTGPSSISKGVLLAGLAAPAIAVAIGMPMWKYLSQNNEFLTWMLDYGRECLGAPLPPATLRTVFNDTPIVVPKAVTHHTHGEAAASRNSAALFAETYCASAALRPFFVQKSLADDRKGYDGNRTYYWAKDVSVPPSFDQHKDTDLLVMVDVDYYIDMPTMLATYKTPVLLYTMTPTDVAEPGCDGVAFTFNRENHLVSSFSGGAKFSHELWDYGVDSLMAVSWSYGMPSVVATWLVDRRRVDKHRSLILLTPTGRWSGMFAWFAYLLFGNRLDRLKVVFAKGDQWFTRLYIMSSDGLKVATGKPGSYASITIDAATDDILKAVARNSKVPIVAPTVESHLPAGSRGGAHILTEYLRAEVGDKPPTVYPVSMGVRRYQFSPGSFEPECKPGLVPFMSPLIHECFAPDQCFANDAQCVKARITDVTSEVEPTQQLMTIIHEFIELVIPDDVAHTLVPYDIEAVMAAQARPSQRHIIDQAALEGPMADVLIKMFVKKEAYLKPNDPRPISQLPPGLKVEYSKFTMAFTAYMKRICWYAFGHTPREIAELVARICVLADWVVKTDFERFDGHVAIILRVIERLLLVRAFRREYTAKVTELHRSQIDVRAVTTFGLKYVVGTSRLSGSPETAVFNGVDNAFMNYLAIRTTRVNGAYPTPQEAWAKLGLYGGDDGITPNVEPDALVRAAKMCGQVIKAEKVLKGSMGVSFLARNYGPNVWFGDPNSCCDLPRQLSKFHATVFLAPNVTPEMKLVEKCRGYYLSDRNTPIIGGLSRKALQLEDRVAEYDPTQNPYGLRSWCTVVPIEDQYINLAADWMCEYARQALPDFNYSAFELYLARAREVKDLLAAPLCCEPKPPVLKAPVVVEDAVEAPEMTKLKNLAEVASGKTKEKKRKRAAAGKPHKQSLDKWAELGERRRSPKK